MVASTMSMALSISIQPIHPPSKHFRHDDVDYNNVDDHDDDDDEKDTKPC